MIAQQVRLPRGHRHPLPDPRRAPPDHLVREIQAVSQSPVVGALLESVDAILLVLNSKRQIVAYNARGPLAGDPTAARGLRPGEALACVNAQGPEGCGAAAACEACGALGAILGCGRARAPVESECSVRTGPPSNAAVELSVRATPLSIEGRTFTVVSLRDVSDEKRRDALEQIFFHDVLNTVTGLRGWVARLRQLDPGPVSERIDHLARHLEREILDQRTLVLAERGELVPDHAAVRVEDVVRDLEAVLSSHAAARDRRLELHPGPPGLELRTDRALLLRILVNMARNALEATPAAGTVRVRAERAACERAGDAEGIEGIRLSVWNEGVIPPEVRPRIFERSFSTKAERGRGLGTYGMKLLGERYLGGRVSFVSAPATGTIFSVQLPANSA